MPAAAVVAAHEPVIAAPIRAADTRLHQQLEELFTACVAAGD